MNPITRNFTLALCALTMLVSQQAHAMEQKSSSKKQRTDEKAVVQNLRLFNRPNSNSDIEPLVFGFLMGVDAKKPGGLCDAVCQTFRQPKKDAQEDSVTGCLGMWLVNKEWCAFMRKHTDLTKLFKHLRANGYAITYSRVCSVEIPAEFDALASLVGPAMTNTMTLLRSDAPQQTTALLDFITKEAPFNLFKALLQPCNFPMVDVADDDAKDEKSIAPKSSQEQLLDFIACTGHGLGILEALSSTNRKDTEAIITLLRSCFGEDHVAWRNFVAKPNVMQMTSLMVAVLFGAAATVRALKKSFDDKEWQALVSKPGLMGITALDFARMPSSIYSIITTMWERDLGKEGKDMMERIEQNKPEIIALLEPPAAPTSSDASAGSAST